MRPSVPFMIIGSLRPATFHEDGNIKPSSGGSASSGGLNVYSRGVNFGGSDGEAARRELAEIWASLAAVEEEVVVQRRSKRWPHLGRRILGVYPADRVEIDGSGKLPVPLSPAPETMKDAGARFE